MRIIAYMNISAEYHAVSFFKAVSNDIRLRLLNILSHFELSVSEIVAIIPVEQSNVSRQLNVLKKSGLITSRRDGLWVFHTVVDSGEGGRFIRSIHYLLDEHPKKENDFKQAKKAIQKRDDKSIQFFKNYADQWAHLKRGVLGDFDLNSKLVEMVSGCGIVADLGCGNGDFVEAISGHVEKIVGIDMSAAMIDKSQARVKEKKLQADIRLGAIEHLPMSDNEVSCVVMNLVLHHLKKPEVGLNEVARALQKNGRLVFVDFDLYEDESMINRYGDRWPGFSYDRIEELFRETGFVIKNSFVQNLKDGLRLRFVEALLK